MGIVDEDVAKVRAATDFVAIASEHIALRRVGTRWTGLCPFHTEKSASFSINAELGLYYCFGCGAKGDVITFVRELEHLDFAEAVEKLAARAGVTLRYDEAPARDAQRQRRGRIHSVLETAIDWYHNRLISGEDASAARGYLRRDRGYDGDVVREYRIGWAPDGWNVLVRSLGSAGVDARDLVDAGLATVDERGRYTDFFRGRILFPIFEAGGKPIGAGGRQMPGGRPPKYKNTAATAVYDKSRVLYGLNWAKKAVVEREQVVVCEGYTDVIGLHGAGVKEAVATCGTALAEGHIRLLTGFARRIVLAYDADAAGQAAAERYYDWERRFEVDIRVAALPTGADPADLARTDPAALREAVAAAQPYLGFRLRRLWSGADLSGPEARARAASAAMSMIAEHPNELVRDQYLMEVADRTRVEPDRLRTMDTPRRADRSPEPRADPRRDEPVVVTITGPELEALRLAVHRPAEIAARLQPVLLAHPVARASFDALAAAQTLHDAIESADPLAADLLQRLAVEDTDADVDDVMARLSERAGQRALASLQADMRQAEAGDQADYSSTIAWLKLTLEALRADGDDAAERHKSAAAAEERLVGWLLAREGEQHKSEAAQIE